MTAELWGDPGFLRELGRMATKDQDQLRRALDGLRAHPNEHPQLVRLHGSGYPGSFRLRVGPHRIIGILLASQGLVFLTTVFTKKRESDYVQALARHDTRLASQGPPLSEYLRDARRR